MQAEITKVAGISLMNVEQVLFDLDGTVISGYMDNPDKNFHRWHVLPNRLNVLALLRQYGISIGLVSNQAGVAYGLVSEADVQRKIAAVAAALQFGHCDFYDGSPEPIQLDVPNRLTPGLVRAHVAYDHPNAKLDAYKQVYEALTEHRRKPSPLMIEEALFGLNRNRALFVGDRPEDEGAAANAGVQFVWAEDFFRPAEAK